MKKVLLIYLWALQVVDCSLQSNLTSFDACCPNLPKPARLFLPRTSVPRVSTVLAFPRALLQHPHRRDCLRSRENARLTNRKTLPIYRHHG